MYSEADGCDQYVLCFVMVMILTSRDRFSNIKTSKIGSVDSKFIFLVFLGTFYSIEQIILFVAEITHLCTFESFMSTRGTTFCLLKGNVLLEDLKTLVDD